MTLAHLSDTHLGYFAYTRTHQGRLNQREVDVASAFKKILDSIVERDPDIVIHSGDFFHAVRPTNYSLIFAYKVLCDFQTKRKGKPLVIIGGNHDSPRSADTTNILRLFADIPGVYVEAGDATTLEIGDLEILCLPSNSLESLQRVGCTPRLGKKHSILTLHGVAKETNFDNPTFEVGDTRPDEWTYVAYGDFHIHTPYGRNICYAGSTEFTSTNIWEEAPHSKGWIWFDSEIGTLEFVPMKTRQIIDLPVIDAAELNADQLGELMREQARWQADQMPIVRQRVMNVLPEIRRGLSIQVIREIDARCLHYRHQLDAPRETITFGKTASQALSLEASWQKHIDASPIPGGVERDALKNHGLDLLKEVADVEVEAVEA